jgi:hypothetical protein
LIYVSGMGDMQLVFVCASASRADAIDLRWMFVMLRAAAVVKGWQSLLWRIRNLAKHDALVSMPAMKELLCFLGMLGIQQCAVVRSEASCVCRVVD